MRMKPFDFLVLHSVYRIWVANKMRVGWFEKHPVRYRLVKMPSGNYVWVVMLEEHYTGDRSPEYVRSLHGVSS